MPHAHRTDRAVLVPLALVALLLATPGALRAQDEEVTLLPYGAPDWAWSVVPHEGLVGFEQPDFDAAAWETGTAGFGSPPGVCPLNEPATCRTPWPIDTDLLLRYWLVVPEGVTGVRIRYAIDNDALIFLDGEMLTDGTQVHEGCPAYGDFEVRVPSELLGPGRHLVAVRARDRGVSSFFDMEIVARPR